MKKQLTLYSNNLQQSRTSFGALIGWLINCYFEAIAAFGTIVGLNVEGIVF
jgi:hypothetical protein